MLQTQDFSNVMQTAFTHSLPGSTIWTFMVSGFSNDIYVQVRIFCHIRVSKAFMLPSAPLSSCCCRHLLTRHHRIITGSALD